MIAKNKIKKDVKRTYYAQAGMSSIYLDRELEEE